jgi:hypothetical protein
MRWWSGGNPIDIAIPKPALSRRHIRFWNDGGSCFVEILDARGGVCVNGEPFPWSESYQRQLSAGDVVTLLSPDVVFIIEEGDRSAEKRIS